MTDFLAQYREVLELVHAHRFVEAISAAGELIAAAESVDDPVARFALGGAMVTRLELKVRLDPDAALVEDCEAVFERYGDAPEPAAALLALTALRIELYLLLQNPEDERVDDAVVRLNSALERTREHPDQRAIARQLLLAIEPLTGRRHAHQAVPLAREVVDRLAASEDESEQQVAAIAQTWIVIAMTHGGEPPAWPDDAPHPDEIFQLVRHKTPAELSEFTDVINELDRCCDLGALGLRAADSLIAEFQTRTGRDRAEAIALLIKISILDHLGQTEEAQRAIRDLTTRFDTATLPGAGEVLTELAAELP